MRKMANPNSSIHNTRAPLIPFAHISLVSKKKKLLREQLRGLLSQCMGAARVGEGQDKGEGGVWRISKRGESSYPNEE